MGAAAEIRSERLRPRHLLLIATIALVVIGCLAVLSAAAGAATGSAFGYFAKAAAVGTVGSILMALLGRGGPGKAGGLILAHRFTQLLLILGVAGVIFVMIPTPITPAINGARLWIVLPGFTIQPSELLKLALVLHLAAALAREPWRVSSIERLRPILLVSGGALALVAYQDLGSALVIAAIVMTLLFVAGTPLRILGLLVGLAILGTAGLAVISPERIERLAIFLNPFSDRYGAGFQTTNGLMAMGSGGVFGQGLGESWQKYVIPEPQTDFILAVIMEEVGLMGATLVMALYVAIVLLGLRIARGTQDPYERLLATGIASIVLWQAALNIWVVLGIAPLTGVPLPLISAGSTSQLVLLGAIGLLLDIDRRSQMPTVSLVEAEPAPVPWSPPRAEPQPAPGELRVIDQRREPVAAPAEQAASQPRATKQTAAQAPPVAKQPAASKQPVAAKKKAPWVARGERKAAAQERQAGAPAARTERPPEPRGSEPRVRRTAQPEVIARTAKLEIRADGTVRLPDGRIGRPKKPILLPDGRVLMPDGKLVSRERATLSQVRGKP